LIVTGSMGLYPLNVLDVEAILTPPDESICDLTAGATFLIEGAVRQFVWQVGFNPSGSIVASTHAFCPLDCSEVGGNITLWDVETGEELAVWSFPERPAFSFSADGTLLAMPGSNGIIQLWGLPAVRCILNDTSPDCE
jgi:WD40 repeat protein